MTKNANSSRSAWKFYGIQRDEIAAIRSQFLLRVMVVDSDPFHNLVNSSLNPDLHWERRYDFSRGLSSVVCLTAVFRLVTVNRLSRILADVTSPTFNIDGRQWQSSIGETFTTYFSVLWNDDQVCRSHCLVALQADAQGQCRKKFDFLSGSS